MVNKSLLLLLTVILALGLVVPGCRPQRAAVPLEDPVPQAANLVGSIKVNEVLADPDLIQAYNEADKGPDMPATFDEALDEVESETGIDPRDFDEAVIFADTESEGDYWGAFVTGTVEEAELIEAIEQEMGVELHETDYGGYVMHVNESAEYALCFLSATQFLVGTARAVEDAVDVASGQAQRLEGPVLDLYETFGDVWVRVAAEVPQEVREAISDDTPLEEEVVERVELVGASLTKQGDEFTVDARVCVGSPVLADTLKATLVGAKLYYENRGDLPPEAVSVLEKMVLSRSGSCAVAVITATVDELEDLIEAMQEEAG